jgi:hypothetical protein
MVAGFAEVAETKDFLVAGAGFEPPTFGLCVNRGTVSYRFYGYEWLSKNP